jgi:hypothetical protein
MNRVQLIAKFQQLHEKLVSLVNQIPPGNREKIMFDKWSLKDVLAHLAAWNELDASRIEALQKGKVYEWIDDWNSFNKVEVEKRQGLNWENIYKEFVNSGKKMVNAYSALDEKLWDKEFGRNNRISATRDLKGMISHQEDHIRELEKVAIHSTLTA